MTENGNLMWHLIINILDATQEIAAPNRTRLVKAADAVNGLAVMNVRRGPVGTYFKLNSNSW